MKLSKISMYFGFAGPIVLWIFSRLSIDFGPVPIFAAIILGVTALIIGIYSLVKEGFTNYALFGVIIGGLWVLFAIFAVFFIL